MLASRFDHAVHEAWPSFEAAINKGLADERNPNLGAIVPVVEQTRDLAGHVQLSWNTGYEYDKHLTVRELTASVSGVYELTMTTRLEDFIKQANVSSAQASDMESFGREARTLEYRWVLSQLIAAAHPIDTLTAAEVEDVTKERGGWRLLVFRQKSAVEIELKGSDDYVEILGAKYADAGGPVAILFPLGGTTVSRLEDFTPSAEQESDALAVSLTARLKLGIVKAVGADASEIPLKKFARVRNAESRARAPGRLRAQGH